MNPDVPSNKASQIKNQLNSIVSSVLQKSKLTQTITNTSANNPMSKLMKSIQFQKNEQKTISKEKDEVQDKKSMDEQKLKRKQERSRTRNKRRRAKKSSKKAENLNKMQQQMKEKSIFKKNVSISQQVLPHNNFNLKVQKINKYMAQKMLQLYHHNVKDNKQTIIDLFDDTTENIQEGTQQKLQTLCQKQPGQISIDENSGLNNQTKQNELKEILKASTLKEKQKNKDGIKLESNHTLIGKSQFYKTRICPQFFKGKCWKGSGCNYAHGQQQLLGKDKYKKKLCTGYKKGQCSKPKEICIYAHGLQDLRVDPSQLQLKQYKKNKYFQKKGNFIENQQAQNMSNIGNANKNQIKKQNLNHNNSIESYKKLRGTDNFYNIFKYNLNHLQIANATSQNQQKSSNDVIDNTKKQQKQQIYDNGYILTHHLNFKNSQQVQKDLKNEKIDHNSTQSRNFSSNELNYKNSHPNNQRFHETNQFQFNPLIGNFSYQYFPANFDYQNPFLSYIQPNLAALVHNNYLTYHFNLIEFTIASFMLMKKNSERIKPQDSLIYSLNSSYLSQSDVRQQGINDTHMNQMNTGI